MARVVWVTSSACGSSDHAELLRGDADTVGRVPPRGCGPGGEDLVVHGVRGVVGGRLVGVAVAEVDVGQLVVADEGAVARGGVDVERGAQRRHDQRVEIGDPACLDHRDVGESGQHLRRHPVAGDDHEPSPGPLEVGQPHGHLVGGVVGSRGVDDELRRVRRDSRRDDVAQLPGRQDLASAVEGQKHRRDQSQGRHHRPPPRRAAEHRDQAAERRRRQVDGDGRRDQVPLRGVGRGPRQVRDEPDAVARGTPQQRLAGQHRDQQGGTDPCGEPRCGRRRGRRREGDRDADHQEGPGDEGDPQLPSGRDRVAAAPDLPDGDRDQGDDQQDETG